MIAHDLVVLDVETSGTNPLVHDVLSIALVPLGPERQPCVVNVRHDQVSWTTYGRRNFERFSSEWQRSAVEPRDAVRRIDQYLRSEFGGGIVTPVGHNVGFDLAFLKRLAFQAGLDQIPLLSHRAIDTHTMLYLLVLRNEIPPSALNSDGAFEYFGLHPGIEERHTSLGDAVATRDLFMTLLDRFGVHPWEFGTEIAQGNR